MAAPEPETTIDRRDALEAFLRFADQMQENLKHDQRPAYAETCCCGGSVELSRDVTGAERRRVSAQFFTTHRFCASGVPGA